MVTLLDLVGQVSRLEIDPTSSMEFAALTCGWQKDAGDSSDSEEGAGTRVSVKRSAEGGCIGDSKGDTEMSPSASPDCDISVCSSCLSFPPERWKTFVIHPLTLLKYGFLGLGGGSLIPQKLADFGIL